jgi:general secretion pathway protein D
MDLHPESEAALDQAGRAIADAWTATDFESLVTLYVGGDLEVRNTQKTKTNLMVFIRPRVVRTAEQAAFETNAKYNYMRNLQLDRDNSKIKLLPGETAPALPPFVGPTAPPTAPSPPPPDSADAPENPGE